MLQTNDFNPEVEKMRERAKVMGISEDVAEKLIQKVLNGELLDSQKPELLKGNTLTVSENNQNYIEFEDGSRIMLAFEGEDIAPTDYSTASIVNMKCPTTTCTLTVRYYDMIWDVKYDASVKIYSGSTPGILSVSNDRFDGVLYSFAKKRLGIIRANASSSSPAKARLQFTATHKTGLYTVTRDLSLYVNNNSSVYARLEWD